MKRVVVFGSPRGHARTLVLPLLVASSAVGAVAAAIVYVTPSAAELDERDAEFRKTMALDGQPTVCKMSMGTKSCSVMLRERPARYTCRKTGCAWDL
jgi:hypothetical protein